MRYGFNEDRTKVDIDQLIANAVAIVNQDLATKVDKETTRALSTNDYTNEDKAKLDGIATGAEVNVNADWNASSGDAQIMNKPTTLSGYGITDAYTKYETEVEIDNAVRDAIQAAIAGTITQMVNEMVGGYVSSLYKYVGSVATYADLPANASNGDTYNVVAAYGSVPAGTNWAWNGTTWDALGGELDLTNYATKAGIEALTNKTYEGFTLANACAKTVDSSIADTSSVNLPTTAAVVAYVSSYLNTALGAIENDNY